MVSSDKIKESAQALRRADPQVYDSFIKRLDEYVYDLISQVVDASHEDIHQAQGRAQAGKAFFRLLTESPKVSSR